LTLVTAGRVGKPHGLDGSFYVDGAGHPLPEGTSVTIGERTHEIERRAGTDDRPLVRLAGVGDPRSLRGELLLVEAELGENEWLAADLMRCSVPGHGRVVRVVDGPSCSVLELEDGVLVPFVSDAIRSVELGEPGGGSGAGSPERGEIRLNEDFLG
jgi:16S rRNA processing protein RimM